MTSMAKKIVGRPALKFKFSVTLEYLEVRLKKEWRPKNLQLVWSRGQRQRDFVVDKDMIKYMKVGDDEVPIEVASASWQQQETATLLVTLYKNTEASKFRRKEYSFALEDNLGLTRRKLAIFPLNLAEYASLEHGSEPLEMEFKPLSNKVESVMAGIQITCDFIKQGVSSDDDMISNFSHVSDDDEEYRRMTMSLNEDNSGAFEFRCPLQQTYNNMGILKNRAAQTKSQLLQDLNISDKTSLNLMGNGECPTAEKQVGSENKPSPEESNPEPVKTTNNASDKVNLRVPLSNGSPRQTRAEKKRRRLSALLDERATTTENRKSSKGILLFNTLRSGMRAVFSGRKESMNFDSDSGIMSDPSRPASLSTVSNASTGSIANNGVRNENSDDYQKLQTKVVELEARNQELCLQCGNLERENAVLQRDADELQTEVGELQLLVEDLRNRLVHAEANRKSSAVETNKIFEQMNLRGWLCKRGVKGGPLGKRWQRRWFSVDANGYLYYYKSNNNEIPRGYIPLDLILAVEDVFPTLQDKNNASFNVITDGRVYELMAHDQEEKERWINALDLIQSWRSQMANVNL
eukprot:Seg2302.2 transcript_id=Seg2302.2/GoldUCD/mRNA.D3Y31 product="EH domain-binding protein 1" protein_id=Seg2302.2/GoldUCD/D3Y31